ncbi:MFS transporter [Amorphoplanes digitatis]|uniref:EmrB/QacA subfamily drug resistance transporter n=1 Tax=Actinoplanes digitatis TaxID=1868 RepID=A0A7W7I156_9ACTN|nr:MFS transporter [Actinoplanes digitatis]MBB4764460.1 EmrB/QacA subfamily drug resistance transporter [Actinoplanes digitatis]GID94053.1 MFS transporter [Actinoplanes digitatis]
MSTSDSLRNRTEAAPAAPRAHTRPPGLILLFLCAAGFMTFLDVSIVNVALPTIEDELNISQNYLQYVVTAYATVLGGFLLLSGRLADTFGRRRMLQTGLLVFAGASLMAGLSQGAAMLVSARALQGLGSAFIAPAALSLLTNTFAEGAPRNKALGAWGAVSGIASVAGVILGGLFTEGPGWRWIFFVNVPIGIVLAALAPLVVAESKAQERRRSFDTAGAVFLTAGLVLMIFTLGETFDHGWTSARTLISLAVTVLLLGTFILIERRAAEPLIPLGIFRKPVLRTANITAVLLFGTLVTLFFFASLFMQQVLDYSPVEAGLAYVPLAIIVSVGAGVASNLVTKVAAKPVLIVGLTLAAIGMLMLWQLPADAGYVTRVLPPFLVVGLGLGLSFVPVQVIAFAGVSKSESGLAAGLINTSQEAGGALGVAVAATIAFSQVHELERWAGGDPALMEIARVSVFHRAFLVGACFAVAGVLMALLLPRIKPEQPPVAA